MTLVRTTPAFAPAPALLRAPAVTLTPTVRHAAARGAARAPGRHREPGSAPWRTALREITAWVTFGTWVPWRTASMRAALTPR